MTAIAPQAMLDISVALKAGELPSTFWSVEDDLCDCVYQRTIQFTNPYLAETHEMRLCCLWGELQKDYPNFVRTIPAYFNLNTKEWEEEPAEWNGEADMPASIWYRQLARKEGISVGAARAKYASRIAEKPVGVPRPVEPQPEYIDPIAVMWEAIVDLAAQVAELQER